MFTKGQLYNFICLSSFSVLVLLTACNSPLPEDVRVVYAELPEEIDFNFHIRPLLSDRCYKCHGPDDATREANFRLDKEASAFAKLQSRGKAFVNSNLKKSIAWQRIISTDPDLQMPPPDSHLSLSANEKALIAKWIEQGAVWKKHWAFIPPVKPGSNSTLTKNPIDYFIQKKLGEVGLSASVPADKERLIRRVTFDLTGLPPSIEEIDKFLADDSPDAYEKLIDRLFSTDAYAERMAMEWLDLARYADSHGLHADGLREMWPWRDWVIRAFKENLTYDEFVTWQLAGDLLPDATRDQKLATAFHRNHRANSEFGIVSEEYRLQYVADRTNTTATAFMGLTMECATCHDHKFDPLSQKEYYEMSAFFNNVPELGMIGNDKNFGPNLLLPDAATEEKLNTLEKEIKQIESAIEMRRDEVNELQKFVNNIQSQKVKLPKPDGIFPLNSITKRKNKKGRTEQILDQNSNTLVRNEAEVVEGKFGKAIRVDKDNEQLFLGGVKNFDLDEGFSAGAWIKPEEEGSFQAVMGNMGDKNTGWRGWIFYLDTLNRPGLKLVHSHSHNYLHVTTKQPVGIDQWTNVFFTYDGSAQAKGLQIFINGQALETTIHKDQLYKNIRPVRTRSYMPDLNRKLKLGIGYNYIFTDTDDMSFTGSYDHVEVFHQYLTKVEVAAIFQKEVNKKEVLADHYLHRHDQRSQQLQNQLVQRRSEKFDLLDPVQEVMVMEEMPAPRKTYLLERGQYTSPGEEVFPNTPSALPAFPDHLPKNRLGLAQWLFDPQHPLTARVAVNRYWQMIFGRGLVETPHDFGSQGALPSHPELLDWLAVTFRESDWDVRALLRTILTSTTYRQSSVATAEHLSKDPKNIYLARASSYRWQAEIIRDNALAASGLLSRAIGGESVKPYQPKGLWKDKNEFSGYLLHYRPDSGDSLYRRSMYTFIRRTSPHPAMVAFDAPDRSVCMVKREKTNTPLQALVLMNDPQFVEASRVLAERMQKEGGKDLKNRTQYAFRLVCGRKPNAKEMHLLQQQYDLAFAKYQNDPGAAEELLEVGEHPFDESLNKIETAALAMVVNTLLNFDDAYMKR